MTASPLDAPARIPRNRVYDYTSEAAGERRAFVEEQTDARLDHVSRYSFEPQALQGNIENFIGVAQVPIGLAGPLRVNGEHAQGDFYIPMATTEGTLVASYNRGMRMITECGGAKTTIVARSMQRSPGHCHVVVRRARSVAASGFVRPLRLRSATCPSPRRGACGAFGLT